MVVRRNRLLWVALVLGLALASTSAPEATTAVYVVAEKWILVAVDTYGMRNGHPLPIEQEKLYLFGDRGFLVHHGARSFEAQSGKSFAFKQLVDEFAGKTGISDIVAKEAQCLWLSGVAYDPKSKADVNAMLLVDSINRCLQNDVSATFDVISFEQDSTGGIYQPMACRLELSRNQESGRRSAPTECEQIGRRSLKTPLVGPLKKSAISRRNYRYQTIWTAATDHLIFRALFGMDKNFFYDSVLKTEPTKEEKRFLQLAERYKQDLNNLSTINPLLVHEGLELDIEYNLLTLEEAATMACRLIRFQLDMTEYHTRSYWGGLLDQGFEEVSWPTRIDSEDGEDGKDKWIQMQWGYAVIGQDGGNIQGAPLLWDQMRIDPCEKFERER